MRLLSVILILIIENVIFIRVGLLCGALVTDGTRYHNADDPASADLGAESDLHTGLVLEGWRSREGQNERGGSLFRAGGKKLC